MKRTIAILSAVLLLASIAMFSGCGGNAEDKAFETFMDEHDALLESMIEPSEDWLNEPDGGESIVLEELEKVDKMLAGLEKLNKNQLSVKIQEAYANIYDSFVAQRAALEDILEEIRRTMLDGPMPGGYSEDRELEPDDFTLLETVMADYVGVTYEPKLVATQVVAGMNYRFTATATATTPDARPSLVYVYIHQPLDGEPELIEVTEVNQ